MSLKNAVLELHPTARPMADFAFQQGDDGTVALVYWNDALGPAPAIEALRVVEPEADRKAALRRDIAAIEVTITPRRIREALLGTDGGWLASKEAAIIELRARL